jgi:hypothetical protein
MKAHVLIFEVWSRECFIEVYIDNQSIIIIIVILKLTIFITLLTFYKLDHSLSVHMIVPALSKGIAYIITV